MPSTSNFLSKLSSYVLRRESSLSRDFFFSCYGDHRNLHVLTPSFPNRRSSDLARGHEACSALSRAVRGLLPDSAARGDAKRGAGLRWSAATGAARGDRKSTRLNSSH